MGAADRYIKASRYDLAEQRHNRAVFHRWMMERPWWVDAPEWQRHPWEGWLLGGIAFLVAGYFMFFAVRSWCKAVRTE